MIEKAYIIELLNTNMLFWHMRTIVAELQAEGVAAFPLLDELLQEYHDNISTFHQVLDLYARVNSTRALARSLSRIDDPDETIRVHVCSLIASYGNVQHTELLIQLASTDPHADVRYVAVCALEFHGDERALAPLQHIQATDEGCDYDGHTIRAAAQKAIEVITARGAASADE